MYSRKIFCVYDFSFGRKVFATALFLSEFGAGKCSLFIWYIASSLRDPFYSTYTFSNSQRSEKRCHFSFSKVSMCVCVFFRSRFAIASKCVYSVGGGVSLTCSFALPYPIYIYA